MSTKSHMPSLDGVRACAFLLVFFHHALPIANELWANQWLKRAAHLFQHGWMGVDIFFVLSGFLITLGLLHSIQRKAYFSHFYTKRALRIFPLYYLCCAVVLFVIPWLVPSIGEEVIGSAAKRWTFFVHGQNWAAANNFDSTGALGHFWSLAIEEQFYLVWPLVVFLMPKNRWGGFVCIGIAVTACLLRVVILSVYGNSAEVGRFIQLATITRIDTLVIGAGLAYFVRYTAAFGNFAFAVRWSLPVLILVAVYLGNFNNWLLQSVGYLIIALGSASLIWLLSFSEMDRSVFAVRPLRYLGKISYGLYVWHWPVLFIASIYLRGQSGPTYAIGFLVGGFVVTLLIAIISFEFFERPFLRLKDRLS